MVAIAVLRREPATPPPALLKPHAVLPSTRTRFPQMRSNRPSSYTHTSSRQINTVCGVRKSAAYHNGVHGVARRHQRRSLITQLGSQASKMCTVAAFGLVSSVGEVERGVAHLSRRSEHPAGQCGPGLTFRLAPSAATTTHTVRDVHISTIDHGSNGAAHLLRPQ